MGMYLHSLSIATFLFSSPYNFSLHTSLQLVVDLLRSLRPHTSYSRLVMYGRPIWALTTHSLGHPTYFFLYTISLLILLGFVHLVPHLASDVALAFVLCSILLVCTFAHHLHILRISTQLTYPHTHPHSYLLKYMTVIIQDFKSMTAREKDKDAEGPRVAPSDDVIRVTPPSELRFNRSPSLFPSPFHYHHGLSAH